MTTLGIFSHLLLKYNAFFFKTVIFNISSGLFRSFRNHDKNIPRPMLSILLGHYFLMNIHFSSRRFIVWSFLSGHQKELYKAGQVQITWLQVTIVPAGGEWGSSWCQFYIANLSNQIYLSFFERHAIPRFNPIEIQKQNYKNTPCVFKRWDYIFDFL